MPQLVTTTAGRATVLVASAAGGRRGAAAAPNLLPGRDATTSVPLTAGRGRRLTRSGRRRVGLSLLRPGGADHGSGGAHHRSTTGSGGKVVTSTNELHDRPRGATVTATLQEPADRPRRGRAGRPGRADYAQGSRTRHGERLDHVFEERCDWMRAYGRVDHLAVDAGDVTLTFGELDARANQLARHLLRRGARPGDRIALLFDHAVYSYVGDARRAEDQRGVRPAGRRLPRRPHRLHRRRPGVAPGAVAVARAQTASRGSRASRPPCSTSTEAERRSPRAAPPGSPTPSAARRSRTSPT